MNFRLEVVCVNDDGEEQRGEVLTMERRQLVMETLGLNLSESRVLLERVHLWSPGRSPRIWNSAEAVRTAASATPAKRAEQSQ